MPSMKDVDKVAEKYERFYVWKHLLKQNFKLCPKILNFGLFIASNDSASPSIEAGSEIPVPNRCEADLL